MVYEKYIKKNGKLYGPYTYHSRRVDGKVISEYHGTNNHKKHFNFIWLFFGILFLIILVSGFFFFNSKISGRATLDVNSVSLNGEYLSGLMSLALKEGELIPASSKVILEVDGNSYEYLLSDLVDEEIVNGDFYVEGKAINGTGQGYGITGVRKIYPQVDFVLNILEEKSTKEKTTSSSSTSQEEQITEQTETQNETETQVEEEISEVIETVEETPVDTQEITEEIVQEEITETEQTEISSESIESESITESDSSESILETLSESSETTTESSSESSSTTIESSETSSDTSTDSSLSEPSFESSSESSSITGDIIKGLFAGTFNFFQTITGQATLKVVNEISGSVSFGESFSYDLSQGESAEIKSVSVNGEVIDNSNIDLDFTEEKVFVTTDYSIDEKGFGEDYLGSKEKVLSINLSKLDLETQSGDFEIQFVYGENEIVSTSKEDSNSEDILEENETIEEVIENITQVNITQVESSFDLTNSEREILIEEFGNVSVEITKAEKVRGRVEVTFEFKGYTTKRSYDSKLSEDELAEWIDRDRVKLLKDIAEELVREELETETIEGIVGSYEI